MNLKPIKRLIVIGTVASAVVSTVKKRFEAQALKSAYNLPDYFTVTAHSGCNGTEDNTIGSLLEAINSGADILELDVNEDENGTALMAHDYIPGNTYPTFEEGLRFIKENSDSVKVNVDLKTTHVSYAADEVIRKLGMTDRCFFTGVDAEDVPTVAATSTVPYYINVHTSVIDMLNEEYWVKKASEIQSLGGLGINCSFKSINKKGVEIMRKNSLLVSVFTPSKDTELDYALTLLPDNITTRNPQYIITRRSLKK